MPLRVASYAMWRQANEDQEPCRQQHTRCFVDTQLRSLTGLTWAACCLGLLSDLRDFTPAEDATQFLARKTDKTGKPQPSVVFVPERQGVGDAGVRVDQVSTSCERHRLDCSAGADSSGFNQPLRAFGRSRADARRPSPTTAGGVARAAVGKRRRGHRVRPARRARSRTARSRGSKARPLVARTRSTDSCDGKSKRVRCRHAQRRPFSWLRRLRVRPVRGRARRLTRPRRSPGLRKLVWVQADFWCTELVSSV